MNRFVGVLCLVVCGGEYTHAAPVTRSLSLAEAAKLALEHRGYRVERSATGSSRVHHDARVGFVEAERIANQTLLNVEVAYWNLYGARKARSNWKHSLETSGEMLRDIESRHEAGTATKEEVAKVRSQCELFRMKCRESLDQVLENEQQLVALTGLEAGSRVRPSDRPSLVQVRPDWKAALDEGISRRPELRMARNEVYWSSVKLSGAKTLDSFMQLSDVDVWELAADLFSVAVGQ